MKLFSSSSALVLGTIENMFLTLILASITPMGGSTSGPSQPANLTASVTTCSKVALVWSASTPPNGASIANYKIYRGGVCIYTNTGATSYTDTTVVAPNPYSYTVSAVDSKKSESAQSLPANVSPCQDQTVPNVPASLNAGAANCSQINLSWNAATDPAGAQYELVSGLKGYNVYRNGSFWQFVTSTAASDTGLAPGTSYSYQITTVDNTGNQSAQVATTAATPACPAGAAANVAMNLVGTTNQIRWTGALGALYQVQCSAGLGGPWLPVDAPTTSFGVDSLAVSDQGMYRVALFTNTLAYRANAEVNRADTIAPSVPGNLTVSMVSTSEVDLAWTPSADTGGSGLAYYFIYRDGLFLQSAPATANSAVDTVLPLTDTANYGVAAIDNAGNLSAQAANSVALRPSCSYTLAPSGTNVSASPANGTFSVTANKPSCNKSASSGYGWIHVTGTSGSTVNYSVDANAASSGRSGNIMVGGVSAFNISQAAAAPSCSYSISSSSASFGSSGGSSSVTVTTGSGCSWSASTAYSWIHTASSGTGSGTVSFSVDSNTSSSSRSGSITVGNGGNITTLTITEAGAAPTCSYSLSSGSASFGSSGGSASVTVTTASGCSWTASTAYSWIHTSSTGTGSGTVSFSVDSNTSSSSRSGSITVGNGGNITTLTITEAGAAPTCSYSLSSSSASFGSGGGSSSVTVTAGTGCGWTASTPYSWIHTSSSGTGSGTVSFSVDPNTSSSTLTGSITIGNGANTTTLTVTEAGVAPTCNYSLSSGSATFGSSGGSANVTVTTGSGCTWTASTAYSWLHTTSSGNGPGTLSFSVDPNTSTSPLSGTITVGNGANFATLIVNEDGAPPTCTYSLSSGSASFSASGGSGSVNMTATGGCGWTASTTYSWLHTASSGNGNGTVNYTVDANGSTSSRSGTITAGGQTLTVNQAGTSCTYSLSSGSASYSAAGGSGSVNMTATSGCGWTASTTYSWLHTSSSGAGNGTVNYSVDSNGSATSRSGSISAGGQTFTVSQSAHSAPFANPGSSQTVGVGATVTFNGSASVSYDGSTITSYNWTFGDSTSASGASVSHAYSTAGTYTVNLTVTDSYGATDPGSITVTVTNSVVQPPSAPTGLSASALNCTNISLSWTGSTDVGGPGLAGYKIYRNGSFLQQVTTTSWTDSTVAASTSYSYSVSAIDTQGRESSQSSAAGATTPTCGGTPGLLQWAWDMTSYFSLSSYAITADHANNVIAVGVVYPATNTANFGGSPVQLPSGRSLFIAKYTSQKTLLWAKTISVSVGGSCTGVTVDTQDNIIVSGYFSGVADFGGGLLASVGFGDAFVAKYSPTGVYIWAKQFSGTGYTYGGSVAVDATNNIVVTANFSTPANFGGINLNPDLAVVKLSASGTTMWARSFASAGGDSVTGVAVDRSGDVFISGRAGGPINLGGGTIGSGGILLAKYSGADGSYKWAKVAGVAGNNMANGVATDPTTGNVFITGGFTGSVDFGSGTAITTPYGQNGGIFLAGYGSSGNYLWSKVWGTSGNSAAGISVDPSGNLAFVGFAAGYLDWQGTGNWTYTGGNMVVGSFTAAGNYRWVDMLGPCYPAAIACDSAGHVAITGHFQGTVDLGGTSLSTIYNPDGFVAQYSQ